MPKIGVLGLLTFAGVLVAIALGAIVVDPGPQGAPSAHASVRPTWPIRLPELSAAGLQLETFRVDPPATCVSFQGGGSCFPFVGEHGGRAVETIFFGPAVQGLLLGAAVPDTTAVEIRRRYSRPLRVSTGPVVRGVGLRFFALVGAPQLDASTDDVVAFDAAGRVLGRTRQFRHPHPGLWERAWQRRLARRLKVTQGWSRT